MGEGDDRIMTAEVHPQTFTTEDIVYHAPAGIPLLARLYRPAATGPLPAVVGVHGGRWCSETRLTNVAIDQALAASGIVVMALDFRMPPDARFPGPVADINYAIRWLKAHAGAYGVVPEWVGGVGTSSGGHQLMLNALTPANLRFTQDHAQGLEAVDPAVAFFVACWPVSDPPARYRYARERQMEVHVRSHEAYWPDEAAMSEGSPQRIVSEGHATHLPPALIIQGGNDVILTPDMSDRFAAAYHAAGGNLVLETFEGEGHTFITKDPASGAAQAAIARIAAFIHAQTDCAAS
jgi:acetyl esterase/lipase